MGSFRILTWRGMLPKLHQLQSLLAINGRVTTFEDRFMIIARKLARRD